MDGYFLAVYKELFGLGLNSLDMLIISQVYEYQKNDLDCHATNEQFSEWFGESLYKIERSVKKLSDLNIINKHTTFIAGKKAKDGKKAGNRQRIMTLNPKDVWKLEVGTSIIKFPKDGESWNQHNQVTNDSSNMHNQVTNSSWNPHNQVIINKSIKEKSISIKEHQNAEDADAELVENDSCDNNTKNHKSSKKYRTWDDCSDKELQEILDGYKEHQESNGTRGLSYNDIAEKYNIKREYINKNNIKNIKTILFNREQARKITAYDDDYDTSDIPDFLNTFDEFNRQLYNKQQKRLEEQEKEKNKKKIA